MERESRRKMVGRFLLALAVVWSTGLAPLAPAARAGAVDGGTEVVWNHAETDPGGDFDRWWGVAGAVLCAAEIRLIRVAPAIGMNPYALAAGLSGCLLALLDVLSTT